VSRPRLHVLFLIDCPPREARVEPNGPKTWDDGARSIDAFATTLLSAGYAPSLFVAPDAAEQHAPLCEDLAARGADVGLLIQPQSLRGAGYKHYLGAYAETEQRDVVLEHVRRFEAALGRRPQSVRSAMYSASDATFGVLSHLGFRQTSISNPGRRVTKHQAVWTGAELGAHFAHATDRLRAGELPLLEIPVTTDTEQCRGGLVPDLAIENGTVDRWHAPLIAGQVARQEDERFRTLCFVTASKFAYHDRGSRFRQTLEGLIEHLLTLDERYEIVPATLAETYAHFRSEPALTKDRT
jgi:hypothetical protein